MTTLIMLVVYVCEELFCETTRMSLKRAWKKATDQTNYLKDYSA